MDALNTFLSVIAKTEGRDKVIVEWFSSLEFSNMPLCTLWIIRSKGQR